VPTFADASYIIWLDWSTLQLKPFNLRLNLHWLMHAHNTKSASENDVTTLGNALLKEIELSETSSDINKPVANKNSRASAKRNKF